MQPLILFADFNIIIGNDESKYENILGVVFPISGPMNDKNYF